MRTLFSPNTGYIFVLLLIQTYLLTYVIFWLLQTVRLLKRPYNGMEHAESLFAAIIVVGALWISSADAPGIFQAASAYDDGHASLAQPYLLFFARSFLIVLLFSVLYVFLNLINMHLLFRSQYQVPGLPVSMLLCAISIGLALVCWVTCREVVDNMTPRVMNYQ